MYQYIKAIKYIFAIFTLFFFFLVFPGEVNADNLLLNSSFEDITGDIPNFWVKNVSTATLSTSSMSKSGTESASINKTNNTTGTIYLYQDVDVEPNTYYSLAGWVVKNDSKFSYSLLRISWRDAGVEISKTDSSQLTSDLPTFQELKIDSVQAPGSSVKARIELLANIASPNPTNPVLFEDISFSQVSAPEQPPSTPIVTPTPTPLPTPTKTPTPVPTKIPTPKPTPTLPPEVLGEASDSGRVENITDLRNLLNPSPSPNSNKSENKFPILPVMFVGSGVILIGLSGFLAYKKQKENPDIIDG